MDAPTTKGARGYGPMALTLPQNSETHISKCFAQNIDFHYPVRKIT